jgi:hypothetical protein
MSLFVGCEKKAKKAVCRLSPGYLGQMIIPKFNFGRNCDNFFGRILPKMLFSAKHMGLSIRGCTHKKLS